MCSHSLSTRHGDDPFRHTTFQKLHLSFVKALSFAPTYRANQFQIQHDLFKFYRNLLLNMGLSKPLQYNGKILYDVKGSIICRYCKVQGKNRVPLLDAYSNPSPWFILWLTMDVFMLWWRENVWQVDEKSSRLSKNINFIIHNADKEAMIVWGRKSMNKTPDNNCQIWLFLWNKVGYYFGTGYR